MNKRSKFLPGSGSVLALLLVTGCASTGQHPAPRSEQDQTRSVRVVAGLNIGGFTFNQTAEDANRVIKETGCKNAPYKNTGVTIDQLLDKSTRQRYIGKIVGLERYDKKRRSRHQIRLTFNQYFRLENITQIHQVNSEDDQGILTSYLEKYPMLVFEGSEDGENYDPITKDRKKITNSNYYFADDGYAFLHLNQLRTYQDDGRYSDVITFNAHEGNFAAEEASKENLRVSLPADSDDD